MADQPVTIEKLINADIDVDNLGKAVNELGVVNPRYGNSYKTIPQIASEYDENSGTKGFNTLAEFEAVKSTIPAHSVIYIGEAGPNQGQNFWDGTTLTKSAYDPLTQAKNYANGNPLFKVRDLTTGEDLNNITDGIYRCTTTVIGDTLLNTPSDLSPKVFTLIAYRADVNQSTAARSVAYQRLIKYDSIETWERVGNGGTTSFAWGAWTKVVNKTDIDSLDAKKLEINLFKNQRLTSEGATLYQATSTVESNYNVIVLNTDAITSVQYEYAPDANLKIGDALTFSAEIYSDVTGSSSGEIIMQFYNGSTLLASSVKAVATVANAWHRITTSYTVPANTTLIRYKFTRRAGNVKFRLPSLLSNNNYLKYYTPSNTTQNIVYVSKTGSDSNSGSATAPFLTIQKAINTILQTGGIVQIAGGEYRETLNIDSYAHIWLRANKDERVKILGSDKLTVTKTSGFTQVYQAPLTNKPTGQGAPRGMPVIFEWGTPSKPINESERHFLHRGHTHRLPYTEMFEAASKAELDTVGGRGKWFWESGIIYFAATDGSDATLKRYEARVRATLTHHKGSLRMTRIDTMFSTAAGGLYWGHLTQREDCRSFGNYFNGFSDFANITLSYRDEAGGNGNDGFNGSITTYNDATDENTKLEAVYFDPYGHDNGDDGLSYHYRGDATIYGGLFEYNTKADVVHVSGAACVCYNTIARGTLNGFYAATATTGDTSRVKTLFRCVNTIAYNNTYSYRAADDADLYCVGTYSDNPTTYGYYQTGSGKIVCKDAKYRGDSAKMKSGNVIIETYQQVI